MPPDTATPETEQPPVPFVPPINPDNPKPPKPPSLEDDANLKMQRIISRRKPAEDKTPDKKEDKKPEEKPADPEGNKALNKQLGKFLGFKEEKPDEKKPEDKKEEKKPEDKKPDEKAPDAATDKTIVKPKKAAAPAPADPVKIASAAATAAVKAAIGERPAPKEQPKPEDSLKSDDLHEYEVAKYLAESNPKFKDAPKIVLDHVRKSEAYADRWEKDNKGKTFDPDDDEHDEFYASLSKPWSEQEFRRAEIKLVSKEDDAGKSLEYDKKIKELETENARVALTPVIERVYTTAASVLAKKIGDDVHEKILKGGFDKFAEEDQVTADAMASAIGSIHPIIEAAIQLDDPKIRFPFDPKNSVHLEWNRLILEKEEKFSGTEDDHGRTMVSRAEYAAMDQAQRAKHWYLTSGHLIEELVSDAAETAKKEIEKENKRIQKLAESRGYVLKEKTDTTNKKPDEKKPDEVKEPVKPASPSSGGGAKIDDKNGAPATGSHKLLETTAGILFRR